MASAGSTPTFESVDKQIQAADLSVFQRKEASTISHRSLRPPRRQPPRTSARPTDRSTDTLLNPRSAPPFIPQKWKDAL